MPDLVTEAGISAGAFYRYFTGKDQLIHEIAREPFAGLGQTVVAHIEQPNAPQNPCSRATVPRSSTPATA